MNFQEFLAKHHKPFRFWASDRTAEQAWQQCGQADWMLWIVGDIVRGQELKQEIMRAAADIARTALVHTTDQRVRDCVAAVDRWLAGEQVDLQAAAEDAEWAADDADTQAAEFAAMAAWAAAHGDAKTAATYAPAGNCHADIVRKHLPWTLIQPLLERAMQEAP